MNPNNLGDFRPKQFCREVVEHWPVSFLWMCLITIVYVNFGFWKPTLAIITIFIGWVSYPAVIEVVRKSILNTVEAKCAAGLLLTIGVLGLLWWCLGTKIFFIYIIAPIVALNLFLLIRIKLKEKREAEFEQEQRH